MNSRLSASSCRIASPVLVCKIRLSLMPSRAEAWELLCEYTKGDSLRKHALAVEVAMRACAKRYAEGYEHRLTYSLRHRRLATGPA